MKAAFRRFAALLGGVMLSAPGASAAVVYESSGGTRTYQFSDSAFTEFGDHLTPVGEDRRIGRAVVPFNTFSTPSTVAYTPAYLRLTLYKDAGGVPGAEISSSTVPGPAFPEGGNSKTGGTPVVFPFPDVEVPGAFLFAVANLNDKFVPQDTTNNPNRLGIFLSADEFPETGTSPGTIVYRSGSTWTADDLGQPPLHVDITFNTPLPEPSSLVVFVLAVFGLACRRPRRARAA